MIKLIKTCVLASLLSASTEVPLLAQSSVSLNIGLLSFTGAYIKQVVSVKNDSSVTYPNILVECGFFRSGQAIAVASAYIQNVPAGGTGFHELLAQSSVQADSSQCRIVK
jgi:hypothetical protein